ncbi:MAG TPA: GNAT family N-acetyltransferase [Clostridiaceae bacterium]
MIRNANLEDKNIIAAYNYNLAKETEDKILDFGILEKGVEAVLKDNSKGIYYIYEEKGKVIGQMMVTKEWSDWRNGEFWWIQSVYVNNDYRGRGIFKELYSHVERLVLDNPDLCGLRLYVERNNKNAQRAYKRLGMEETNYKLYELDKTLDKG